MQPNDSIFTDSMDSDSDDSLMAMTADSADSLHSTGDDTLVAEQIAEPESLGIEKQGPGCPPKLKEGIQPCLVLMRMIATEYYLLTCNLAQYLPCLKHSQSRIPSVCSPTWK